MNFQLLLKDLEEVKSVIYEDTERAEELLDHVIREVSINAAQQKRAADESPSTRSGIRFEIPTTRRVGNDGF